MLKLKYMQQNDTTDLWLLLTLAHSVSYLLSWIGFQGRI